MRDKYDYTEYYRNQDGLLTSVQEYSNPFRRLKLKDNQLLYDFSSRILVVQDTAGITSLDTDGRLRINTAGDKLINTDNSISVVITSPSDSYSPLFDKTTGFLRIVFDNDTTVYKPFHRNGALRVNADFGAVIEGALLLEDTFFILLETNDFILIE